MAITHTYMDLTTLLKIDSITAQRIFPVAKAIIKEYGRGSVFPDGIEDEGLLRVAGYLLHGMNPGVVSRRVDDLAIRYDYRVTSIIERSGAAAIMGRWICRRAKA